MIRIFAILPLAAVLLVNLVTPALAWLPGEVVLGGEYHIGPGETLSEDISFYFSQVTIDESASLDGHIFLFSSTLDLRGHVTEDIHAYESDLILRENSQVDGEIDESDFIHWTLLLPALAQIP